VISDIVDIFHLPQTLRAAVDCIVFTIVGVIVSIGLVDPSSPSQAITAGLGWTGLFTYQTR